MSALAVESREMVHEFRCLGNVQRTLPPRAPYVLAATQWKRPVLHIAVAEREYEQHTNDPNYSNAVTFAGRRDQVQTMCKANIKTKHARWHDDIGEFQVCVTCAHRAEQKRFEEAAMANPSPALLRERVEHLMGGAHG